MVSDIRCFLPSGIAVAEWSTASYIGPQHAGNVRQGPARDFGGKNPVDHYLVMIHGAAESVADQIQSIAAGIGMTYLMAAPMSGRSFRLLTDKVLPRLGDERRVRSASQPAAESRRPTGGIGAF